MLCFQTAFKIDPDIDVIYRGRRASSSSSVDWEDDEEQGQLTTLPNPANLEHQFSQEQLSYTPRKKNKPVLINKLPGTQKIEANKPKETTEDLWGASVLKTTRQIMPICSFFVFVRRDSGGSPVRGVSPISGHHCSIRARLQSVLFVHTITNSVAPCE